MAFDATKPADGTDCASVDDEIRANFVALQKGEDHTAGTEPAYKVEGTLWYDSTNNLFKTYTGSAWQTCVFTGDETVIRGWINLNGTGTAAINDSFNVDSITDNGTGDYTITWDTDFANTTYALAGMAITLGSNDQSTVQIKTGTTLATGSCNIIVTAEEGSAVDRSIITVIAIGDQ